MVTSLVMILSIMIIQDDNSYDKNHYNNDNDNGNVSVMIKVGMCQCQNPTIHDKVQLGPVARR